MIGIEDLRTYSLDVFTKKGNEVLEDLKSRGYSKEDIDLFAAMTFKTAAFTLEIVAEIIAANNAKIEADIKEMLR
ncbi:MAG: hypothetical protein GX493_13465 [Firmicutes bacterium]|nr:hypothetical protein [Bacillota bacterium]